MPLEHVEAMFIHYGGTLGIKNARKHIGWAVRSLPGGEAFRGAMNAIDDCRAQVQAVSDFFDRLADRHATLPASNDALSRLAA